ncbi:MAG: 3-oxoacyl-ACP synthase [endosymbiont of Seepiophila jonesi]|uniref:3-oxoacyl-ACP synthase n=1 Tax=endosymbiont of Lamellibrachia luymesi TaxID=2200907 RepID=A0A370E1U8_9GAMM|nr:MAG: 3-oxoacyl-ACP synthase [endosymbiont of Seepiophila jonesi]RDH93496.1 MAG: 3-oxoacyl-ACP synthase [endosymbiont of Lamellibrachia luymesi]
MLSFYLEAPAVAAPGLDGWANAKPVLAEESAYRQTPLPDYVPKILPPTAQRRGSQSTLLATQAAQESLGTTEIAPAELASIFASSIGDPEIVDRLCSALADPQPMVSPTQFHNSVHNAPAGYWSIAIDSLEGTNSLAASDASFVAGLLSAAVQCRAESRSLLLVAYDLPFEAPLDATRPLSAPFATSMVVTPSATRQTQLHCTLEINAISAPASRMADAKLEQLRIGNPAARALPLLQQLASPTDEETLTFDYLPDCQLQLKCKPC